MKYDKIRRNPKQLLLTGFRLSDFEAFLSSFKKQPINDF